jgi:hypothetical protein
VREREREMRWMRCTYRDEMEMRWMRLEEYICGDEMDEVGGVDLRKRIQWRCSSTPSRMENGKWKMENGKKWKMAVGDTSLACSELRVRE